MVVDSSALLAVLLGEPASAWVVERLTENSDRLLMSTVNLTEVLIRLRDLQPDDFEVLRGELYRGWVRYVPPNTTHAEIAAQARLEYPLNLGDCFAYALAVVEDCPILTLDTDFRVVDRPVLMP